MKKEYIKPEIQAVEIKTDQTMQTVSNAPQAIFDEEWDDEWD